MGLRPRASTFMSLTFALQIEDQVNVIPDSVSKRLVTEMIVRIETTRDLIKLQLQIYLTLTLSVIVPDAEFLL